MATRKTDLNLVEGTLAGDRLSLSRLLTQIENDTPAGRAALDELFPHTGQAHLVGITGAPGTGKSSLVNGLVRAFRRPPEGIEPVRVGVVAVDPSSPFTGGALLGDRLRMRDSQGDPGVFIRSMAARGTLGGLARATAAVVQAMDAGGYGVILIETVGAGQSEVDIARLAHTTLVVEAPGLGDDIQAIKAGILEIADILVVNKADRPGVESAERALRAMIELGHTIRPQVESELAPWVPPVLRVIATEQSGVEAVAEAIRLHAGYLQASGERQERDRARLESELNTLLRETLLLRWQASPPAQQYAAVLQRVIDRQLSPLQAAAALAGDPQNPNAS